MPRKSMSDLDAFLALEDIRDEDVKMPLREGKGFNVRDEKDMDKAEEFVNQDSKKEVALEVIDVDADSLEHLKNNEEYVGQMILQCNSCKANRFINAEDLVQSEGDEEVYNIEDECPHCHGKGNGFHLIGQVGKVEGEEEATFDNDSLTDAPKFDNEPTEETPEEEQPNEEEPNEEPTEETEDNGLETSAEDDTADMESTLGNEYDSNDVEWDDTEEKPAEENKEDSLTEINPEDEEFTSIEPEEDEEKKKEKKESLEEEVEPFVENTSEFFEQFVEPENIQSVLVFDLDDDNEDEEIFNGSYEELSPEILNSEFLEFDVAQGNLIVNIDSDSDIDELTPTLRNALEKFTDEFNDKISVWDQATGDEIFQGTKQSVIEEFGHNAFLSFEAPERLQIKVRNLSLNDALKTPYKEDLDLSDPKEKLIADIIKENNLKEYKVDTYGSEEYWIADSIRNLEDLDHIYNNYVQRRSGDLALRFKDVTGYKDKFDLAAEQNECLNEGKEETEEEVREEAKSKLTDPEIQAVIYGYESRGKFHRVQGELLEIRSDRELGLATELVKAKYHPTGSVKVFYRNDLEESVDYKNRKDLSEAILKCEAEGVNYKIKKSLKEGYRYTLLKEAPQLGFFNAPAEIEEPAQEQPAAVIDPRDAELVNKLTRIAHDIATSIQNNYGVECDERAILADMIQDLQLISGQITPEQLADTPLNSLTREMYAAYNGFYEALDELVSFETGRQITTSQAEKIQQALDSLDDERFSPEGIEEGVRDENFLLALQHAQVPGITYQGNPQDIQLLTAPEEEDFDGEESLNEEKTGKSVGSVLNDYQEEWGYELNPNGMRNAVLKCLEKHKNELDEESYKYAVMQFTNCKPSAVFGMIAAFTSGMAITPNNQYKQNQKDLQGESLEESVDIHIEGNEVTIADNSGEDVAIIPVEPEGEEAPTEEETELEIEEPTEETKESLNEDKKEIYVVRGENADSSEIVFEGTYDECEEYVERAEAEDAETYGEDNPDTFEYFIELKESLEEAKKDDELPADPEVVKTNVHATLNNLVTDEIEAINAYEEAKAEIADTHIEHKDDIINTIDHIEDEEKEHVDELVQAGIEIPFDKERQELRDKEIEAEKANAEIEAEIEEEPEDEETLEFDETKFESFINEWFDKNSEETKVFEAVKGNFKDDGTIILEGKLLKEEAEENVTFTLTPNKEINEELLNSKKVTTYTITSTCLPEGLVVNESQLGWAIFGIENWLAKYQKETNQSWEELSTKIDELADKYADSLVSDDIKKEDIKIDFVKNTLTWLLDLAVKGEKIPGID